MAAVWPRAVRHRISRSTVLRFQGLLIFGYAVLDGIAWGAVQGVQEAAKTRPMAVSSASYNAGARGWGWQQDPGTIALRDTSHGREEDLAFGSPFIGQGTELVGTPLFCAHYSSPLSVPVAASQRHQKLSQYVTLDSGVVPLKERFQEFIAQALDGTAGLRLSMLGYTLHILGETMQGVSDFLP